MTEQQFRALLDYIDERIDFVTNKPVLDDATTRLRRIHLIDQAIENAGFISGDPDIEL